MNYGMGETTMHYAFCRYTYECTFVTADYDNEQAAEREMLEHLCEYHGVEDE